MSPGGLAGDSSGLSSFLFKQMKVLIADDSSISRRLLQATLARWDYQVEVACDGAEAWELLQCENAPNLAILDWMMPALTGPEVCRLVRQQSRETYTYILLLTAKSDREDLIEGLESGADDYVVKPFDQHELKVRLRAGRRILDLQAELVRAREALREQATRDFLTGTWNRHAILDILRRELARAERNESWVGIVLCDLDHFKLVNDTYGHAAGDTVLREAAARMLAEVRPYDGVGRYGGEEFLIVLPGCNEADCLRKADRMRESLASRPVDFVGGSIDISASFGATSAFCPSPSDAEELIHAADLALYRAKHLGRNRTVFASCDRKIYRAFS
mgnify:CR=1 FL=1